MPVALIRSQKVSEVFPSREEIAGRYHPDFIASLVDIPDHVKINWYVVDGQWLERLPPPPPTADDYAAAIQSHVDATAKARGYADGVALAGYSTSTVPAWAAEAQAFIGWRDSVWLYAYLELSQVQSGQKPPQAIADFVGNLPTIDWP